MFKVSFSTLSCPDWNWETIVSEAACLGFDGIEARGVKSELRLSRAYPFIPENLQKTVQDLKAKNLELVCFGSSCDFHDKEKHEEVLDEGKDYVDLAESAGVPYIRIFGDNVDDPAQKNEILTFISDGIIQLCKYCTGKNVMLLIETHGDFYDPEYLATVLEKVNSPLLGVLWDIEHTYIKYGTDIGSFLNIAGGYIKHTHIKDVKKAGDSFKICLPGNGDIPLEVIIDELGKRGYNGYLSLEWEKRWVPELEEPEIVLPVYINLINKIIKRG